MSRIHPRFRHLDDEPYDEEILHRHASYINLPIRVKMSYPFYRDQLHCFEILVQRYWSFDIEPVPADDRKPVPSMVKIALSWVVGEDKTSLPDSALVEIMNDMMAKRVNSWKQFCVVGAPSRSPVPKSLQFRFRFGTSPCLEEPSRSPPSGHVGGAPCPRTVEKLGSPASAGVSVTDSSAELNLNEA